MAQAPHVKFRAEQKKILDYAQGRVGIAAVPGSGKTFTLAHLAARLVASGRLDFAQEQEVLVVTFTNTAVNSFRSRIDRILREEYALLPYVGYRVRTLHGLAHDIVRERPALVGLSDDFVILDERLALEIQRDIVVQSLAEWWERLSVYLDPEKVTDPKKARYSLEQDLPTLVSRFIKHAKDLQQSSDQLLVTLSSAEDHFELARFAISVYRDYQRSLAYRGAVDFDDLVRLALQALDLDEQYLARLRHRWPYILEDEAQDSSHLQEQMLSLLSQKQNWVRVGDPNQAINTTFTTASPDHLLNFLDGTKNPGVIEYPLSVSGRSAPPIIALANELVRWSVEEHPTPELRDAFDLREDKRVRRGVIRPTGKSDPQPNPAAENSVIEIFYRPDQKIKPDQELELVVEGEDFALVNWLEEIQHLPEVERPTVAVLVPENSRGFKLAEILSRRGIPFEELLRSTTDTRQAAALLRTVLEYLAEPTDLKRLKQLYWTLMTPAVKEIVKDDLGLRDILTKFFSRVHNLEDFLWPSSLTSPVEGVDGYPWLADDLILFQTRVRRWLEAVNLPIDQLVLIIGQDLFTDAVDVALTYKIAVLLRDTASIYADWRLPQFVEELRVISNNERKFIGFDDAEMGYEPKPGIVTVATMHAAKGLEWDRVYLMSVSNYGFPSAQAYDLYIGERWYVRDGLNMEAEALAQLEALVDGKSYVEGRATLDARLDYARERLRLLYVGITRARRDLIITWNVGRYWQEGHDNQPALAVIMLSEYTQQLSGEVI